MGRSYNLNSGYGAALAAGLHAQVPSFGRVFVVLDADDAGEEKYDRMQDLFTPDPAGQLRFYNSLETVIDGDGTHSISDGVALTKNRVHFIGMDGGDRLVQQGAKISLSGNVATAYVLKNTGVRNSFRNIKFIQSSTNAAALHVAEMGGEGNLYKNVSFTFGVVDNLDLTTASEVICGEDSGTFIGCQFGQDTLLTSAARSIMTIDQVTASQEFKSNVFVDCTWLGSSSDADMQAISMAAAGDILFSNHFIRPSFIASIDSAGGIACTKAVSTANGTTKGTIYISYPMVHGFDDVGINGTNNDNLFVFSHVPSAVNITSAKPTTA